LERQRTATLQEALRQQRFSPAPNPSLDLIPGTIISLAQDGSVAIRFQQQDAFPTLKVQSSNFDFSQFTSLGGTAEGFTQIGLFNCQQAFREELGSAHNLTLAPAVDSAMKQDPSLYVVRSVLGCYGYDGFPPSPYSRPEPKKRYIVGFQLATTIRH
jgi:hypothetical protein